MSLLNTINARVPVYAKEFWQCICGVLVPPTYGGVCGCGEMHPQLTREMDESDVQ